MARTANGVKGASLRPQPLTIRKSQAKSTDAQPPVDPLLRDIDTLRYEFQHSQFYRKLDNAIDRYAELGKPRK